MTKNYDYHLIKKMKCNRSLLSPLANTARQGNLKILYVLLQISWSFGGQHFRKAKQRRKYGFRHLTSYKNIPVELTCGWPARRQAPRWGENPAPGPSAVLPSDRCSLVSTTLAFLLINTEFTNNFTILYNIVFPIAAICNVKEPVNQRARQITLTPLLTSALWNKLYHFQQWLAFLQVFPQGENCASLFDKRKSLITVYWKYLHQMDCY